MSARHDPLNRRGEARAAGLATYDTGVPCKNGHLSPRYTATKLCVQCKHDTFVKQYTKDKGRWLQYASNWRDKNREAVNEYAKIYRAKYPEKIANNAKRANIERRAERTALERNRQAKKLQAIPKWLNKEQLLSIKHTYVKAKELSTIKTYEEYAGDEYFIVQPQMVKDYIETKILNS